jgi:hypothetical protein
LAKVDNKSRGKRLLSGQPIPFPKGLAMPTLLRELPADLVLLSGQHRENDQNEMCVMEAVAFVAGEPWSDQPQCASEVLGAFLRIWNDDLPDAETRTRLLSPLIPKIIGTRGTPKQERVRAMLCVDWLIREWLPAWLDLIATGKEIATEIRAIKPIQNWDASDAVIEIVTRSRNISSAAESSARSSARIAARIAAEIALTPTVTALQSSAIKLIDRMIEVE